MCVLQLLNMKSFEEDKFCSFCDFVNTAKHLTQKIHIIEQKITCVDHGVATQRLSHVMFSDYVTTKLFSVSKFFTYVYIWYMKNLL